MSKSRIGELVSQLMESGATVTISPDMRKPVPDNGRVRIQLPGSFPTPRPRDFTSGSLIDRLQSAVTEARLRQPGKTGGDKKQ